MHTQAIQIHVDGVGLDGDVAVPDAATGCVILAHGSGSSRRSPRNQQVARALQESGLVTVLFDLLSPVEARTDAIDTSMRFDVPLLGGRLIATLDDVSSRAAVRSLPIGLFGASTGAAAALACAQRQDLVQSVVSRGADRTSPVRTSAE